MRQKFNPKAHIEALNILRHQLSKFPFTNDMLREGLQSCKIPANTLFLAVFCNSGLIQQIEENLYCFTEPNKPIHFSILTDIYNEYKRKIDSYRNNYLEKKRREELLERKDILAAIKLLEENGFMIKIL